MNDESIIRQYGCYRKANSANKRFTDKITKEDVLFSLKLNNLNCFYCNEKISFKYWELDHFEPRANGGLNVRNNLVACCKWCNTMKNALDGNAFINKCFNVVNNNFFKINNIEKRLEDKFVNQRISKIKKKMKKLNIEFNDELILYLKDSFLIHDNRNS